MKSIVFHNFVLRALQESSGSVYFVWFILRVANQVEPQRRSDTLGVHGWTECITIFLRSHSEPFSTDNSICWSGADEVEGFHWLHQTSISIQPVPL
ncbi:hypothetical protein OUZ56_028277 [Daphnia magna]|uniref:Uncharacterized protein n=1 Tax=Daphnia magna TaxID=35525 RepID=A0ABR0B3H7_9CRUS|nr:hypothetical protein OUZ56_028277 [Daphnia magna]